MPPIARSLYILLARSDDPEKTNKSVLMAATVSRAIPHEVQFGFTVALAGIGRGRKWSKPWRNMHQWFSVRFWLLATGRISRLICGWKYLLYVNAMNYYC